MIGSRLLHYLVEQQLGRGGMGTVYLARDTVLDRTVAIKVLEVADEAHRERLLHEARAASALNHPGIVTIHGVQQQGDVAFIVMEHVDGTPLDRVVPLGGLPLVQALQFALDVADAVAEAHAHGIVHRDIKPANVMITRAGRVKVLDFGIARRTALPDEATRMATAGTRFNALGVAAGTPGYMAPEQITGHPGGPPSDVFALGALLFYLLTGHGPFAGPSSWAVLEATMRPDLPSLAEVTPAIPAPVAQVVSQALAKDPAARFPTARELHRAIADALTAVAPASTSRGVPRGMVVTAGVVLLAIVAGGWWWQRSREAQRRWVRDEAIPGISRLAAEGDPVGAYRLAQRALAVAPDDPQLVAAWDGATNDRSITTEPEGVEVSIRTLSGQDDGWVVLGRTPVNVRLPFAQMRWRFVLDGYESREIIPSPTPSELVLAKPGEWPAGMVHVSAGDAELPVENGSTNVPEFFIDATEVTNRQFKAFVDAGGYQKPEYWLQPFVDGGRTIPWEQAVARFRDTTGRPGPATWEVGTFPEGAADLPVSGVSWYEAMAYATFAGKQLPTIYHWQRAAGLSGVFSDVLQVSNFAGKGPLPVGASGSLGPFGTADQAGNVKEWVWNESQAGLRFVLGGAWFEAAYAFHDEDARAPFTREPGFGFRCMQAPAPVDTRLQTAIVTLERDPAALVPVGDDVFRAHASLYDYDARPLDARLDERDEVPADWIVERVSFTTSYGADRLPVILLLPKTGRPPYQVAVYFPGSDATRSTSSRSAYTQWLQFVVRSGRAAAFPIYQQTYERRRQPTGANFLREISIQRGLDVRRTVDYLASRPDIDASRIAFFGVSLGAQLGPVYLAVEPRLKTGVLLSGGFESWAIPAETDPVNFAPRVRQPVLMVNGREDFDLPYETAQIPLFKALGSAAGDKRHAVLEGGHIPPRPQLVYKEILDWLDRYLGPVQ
jgi:formylglycine-generating enzyme required for sulfatase activity/dienelactone hydrolase/predicted Ser/Thr protein kinase